MAFDLDKELAAMQAKKKKPRQTSEQLTFDLDAFLDIEPAPKRRGRVPDSMSRKSFIIERGTDGKLEVSGFVHEAAPGIGVHKDGKLWILTHLKSGKSIGTLDPKVHLLAQSIESLGGIVDWVLPQKKLMSEIGILGRLPSSSFREPTGFVPSQYFVFTQEVEEKERVHRKARDQAQRRDDESRRAAKAWSKKFNNTTATSILNEWTREVNRALRTRGPLPEGLGLIFTRDIPGWDQQFASGVRVAGFPYFFANPRSSGTPRNADTYVHPGHTIAPEKVPYFTIETQPLAPGGVKKPRKLILRGDARKAADRFFAALLSYWNKAAEAKGIHYWGPWNQSNLQGLSVEDSAKARIATEYYSDSGANIPRTYGQVFEWNSGHDDSGLWVADTSQFYYGKNSGGEWSPDFPPVLKRYGIKKPLHKNWSSYAELYEVVPKKLWHPAKKKGKWDLGETAPPYRYHGRYTPFNQSGIPVRSNGKDYVRTGKVLLVPISTLSWDIRFDTDVGRAIVIDGKAFVILGFRKLPGRKRRVGKDAWRLGDIDPTGVYAAPVLKSGRLGTPVFLNDIRALGKGLSLTHVDHGRLDQYPWNGWRGEVTIKDVASVDKQIERINRRITGVSGQKINPDLDILTHEHRWKKRGESWRGEGWRGVKKEQVEYKRWLESIRKKLFAHLPPGASRLFKPKFTKPKKSDLKKNDSYSIVATYPISSELERVGAILPDLYIRKY